jgi:prepilin-type N-terminal cleavage/methylation domain-containing protein/prepilin-type processing-associated H-X9-DG protein
MIKEQRQPRAFTLLELVVVIGIVAMATALILPAISAARGGAGDIGCQNNMRQLLVALQSFNTDHNGLMPNGFFYVGSGPPTWGPPPKGNGEYISWVSELNEYFGNPTGFAPAFRCPVALQQAPPHMVSYVMNIIVAISPYYEALIAMGSPNAQTKTPSVHLMRREGTALIWDTGVRPNWQKQEGHLVSADLDSQRFWFGARSPQYRYYSPHDPFGSIPPGVFGYNQPIQLNLSSYVFYNKDPDIAAIERWPYQGNLRFRHNKQTQCNVAFSDGSVRQYTAVINPNNTVASHNAIRKQFMIDWPPGVTPDPSVPGFADPPGLFLIKEPMSLDFDKHPRRAD